MLKCNLHDCSCCFLKDMDRTEVTFFCSEPIIKLFKFLEDLGPVPFAHQNGRWNFPSVPCHPPPYACITIRHCTKWSQHHLSQMGSMHNSSSIHERGVSESTSRFGSPPCSKRSRMVRAATSGPSVNRRTAIIFSASVVCSSTTVLGFISWSSKNKIVSYR